MSEAPVDKYDYNRFGAKGKRVGQAVFDILSQPQQFQTVGDTLDAFGPDYAKQIEQCIHDNQGKYKNPFYIFVLTKKEFWANNVLRNWFIARQSPPHAFDMMEQYSNYTKTLYIVDSHKGNIKALWSLPSWDDCISIAKCPQKYDPELVKWVEDCFTRELDKDSYSFDWAVNQ
jgi:hypothetical protein